MKDGEQKASFLANMSHELRSPLHAILGLSELLYEEALGPLNEEQKEFVGGILEKGQSLAAHLDELLMMEYLEAGRYSLQREALVLRGFLLDWRLECEVLARSRGFEVEVTWPKIAERGLIVRMDGKKCRELLTRLLEHLLDASRYPGKIDVEVDLRGEWLSIWVTRPVAEARDELSGLFWPFLEYPSIPRQLSSLKLSIARSLLELMGGTASWVGAREPKALVVGWPIRRMAEEGSLGVGDGDVGDDV